IMPLTERARDRKWKRMRLRCVLLAFASIACSSRGDDPPVDPPVDPPPADAPPPPADPTLHIASSSVTVSPVRDHHVTVIVGSFLYVIGGTDAWTTIHDDVLRAHIGEDGSLGAFEHIGTLPEPRAGHAAVVVGQHFVISGGHTMSASGAMSSLD